MNRGFGTDTALGEFQSFFLKGFVHPTNYKSLLDKLSSIEFQSFFLKGFVHLIMGKVAFIIVEMCSNPFF